MIDATQVLALTGGVGGAKLVWGLAQHIGGDGLMVVCNTGDDFRHLGVDISPDIDTVLYTLGGIAHSERGWGRGEETWSFMRVLQQLGGETWFQLGDGDLALHMERTRRLVRGDSLTDIVDDFRRRFGIGARVVPMSDRAVSTIVHTAEGPLAFQHYFVRERCEPQVTRFEFKGASRAEPSRGFWEGLYSDALQAIVICPSNPFISIDPILSLPGIRKTLRETQAPVIAVSPIIGGQAVKGPTAKMMRELGLQSNAATVFDHYRDLVDGFVIDNVDRALEKDIDVPCHVTTTLMRDAQSKRELAAEVLTFARSIASSRAP